MLQELVDESGSQGLKMNKSKTKVMMENDTPIYVKYTKTENVESYVCLGERYTPETKTKSKRFKEAVKTTTAISSRVTLEHA